MSLASPFKAGSHQTTNPKMKMFVSRGGWCCTTTTTTTTEARRRPFSGGGGGLANKRESSPQKSTFLRFCRVQAARRSGGGEGGGQRRKKASIKKASEKRLKTEFIEREDAKMATFERAEAAARRLSSTTTEDGASSSKSSSSSSSILEEKSFEAKLKRVREEGETRAKMTGGTGGSSTSTSSPAAFGGTPTMTPISPLAPTFGGDESFSTKDDDEEESAFKSPLVRVGALLAAMALVVVFVPTDLTFNAIGSKRVQEKYRKEALEDIEKQKNELTKVLENTPDDPELLKRQAQNFLALDDYPSALPLMEKLIDLEDTEANSMAIAEVWDLDGQPDRGLTVLKTYADAHLNDPTGPPSASFLKALTDSLSKNNRQGVALAYVDAFVEKNPPDIDRVDADLLKARVYSGWKGKGKEAEKAFADVVERHPDDFRGYLAKGVFAREIGRPDEATAMFKQAEALVAPDDDDTKSVVKDVIARANAQQGEGKK